MPGKQVPIEALDLQDTLEYKEHPIRILDHATKETRSTTIQWSNHTEREATWEQESELRKHYPYLFERYVSPESRGRDSCKGGSL